MTKKVKIHNRTISTVRCVCKHEWQDKRYGNQMRIANATAKGDDNSREVRCTVCKTIHRVSDSQLR
jgi:hypothetical protein